MPVGFIRETKQASNDVYCWTGTFIKLMCLSMLASTRAFPNAVHVM